MENNRNSNKTKSNSKANREIERLEQSKFGMYKGPLRLKGSSYTGQMKVLQCTSSTTMSSSGLGVIATELTFNPNTTNEWASFSARFREYRVLGCEVHYIPYLVVNTSTIASAPIVVGLNKGGAIGTPTTFNQVLMLAKSVVHHTCKKWVFAIRPDDYTDLDVGAVSSPSSEFSMLVYGDGLSNTITYGRIVVYWVIQFSSSQ